MSERIENGQKCHSRTLLLRGDSYVSRDRLYRELRPATFVSHVLELGAARGQEEEGIMG